MSHPKIQFINAYKEELRKLANLEISAFQEGDILPEEDIERIKNLLDKQWTELTEDDHEYVDFLGISEEEWPSDLDKLQEILVDIYNDKPSVENIVMPLYLILHYIIQRIELEREIELKSTTKHYDSDQIFDSIVEYSDNFCDYYLLSMIQCPSKDIRLALKHALINKDKEEFCRVFETNHCDAHDLDIFLSSDISLLLSANHIIHDDNTTLLSTDNKKIVFDTLMKGDNIDQLWDILNTVMPEEAQQDKEKIEIFYEEYYKERTEWYPKFGEDENENDSNLVILICNHIIDYSGLKYIKSFGAKEFLWYAIKQYNEEGKLWPCEISIINEILNRPGGKELVEEWEKEGEEGDGNGDITEQDTPDNEENVIFKNRKEAARETLDEFFHEWTLEKINSTETVFNTTKNKFPYQRLWLNKQAVFKKYEKKTLNEKLKEPLKEVFIENFRRIYTFLTTESTDPRNDTSIINSLSNCKLLFYMFSGINCGINSEPITWTGSDAEYLRFIIEMINDTRNHIKSSQFFIMKGGRPTPPGSKAGQANKGKYATRVEVLKSELDIIE